MKINSTLLGEIEFDENYIINFPQGIPGFEDEKEYILLPMDEKGIYFYFQSVKNTELCLLICEPFTFFPDYEVDIDDEYLSSIGIKREGQDMSVYLVLTVPSDYKLTTANLVAPLIINPQSRQGIQYITTKNAYTTRHNIFRQDPKTASSGGEGR